MTNDIHPEREALSRAKFAMEMERWNWKSEASTDLKREAYALVCAAIAHPERSLATPEAPLFQERMGEWTIACFGAEIASDKTERSHRFIEEALELVQACGTTASEAHQLVDYVFGRPVGEMSQEIGGVMTTLAALCCAHGVSMDDCAEAELARIWTKVEVIRAKQAAKPKHSPLPAPPPAPPLPAGEEFTKVRSIIHQCPAIRLPQSFLEKLGGVAQIVALKGADDAMADKLIAQLNASTLPAAVVQEPVALWQYRWTNPGDLEHQAPSALEWKPVVASSLLQSIDEAVQELRSYTYDGKPTYEVRALFTRPTPLTAGVPSYAQLQEMAWLLRLVPRGEVVPVQILEVLNEQFKAAMSAAGISGGWLSIETAPKDGTDVLLSNGESVAEGHWLHAEAYIREHRDLEGRYIDQDESDGHDGWIDWGGGMLPEPTHWMPKPKPPLSATSLGEGG